MSLFGNPSATNAQTCISLGERGCDSLIGNRQNIVETPAQLNARRFANGPPSHRPSERANKSKTCNALNTRSLRTR